MKPRWSTPYKGLSHLTHNGWTASVTEYKTFATLFLYHRTTPNKLTDPTLLTTHESAAAARQYAEAQLKLTAAAPA